MDIVERLRKVFGVVVKADDCFEEDYSVAREAADEIERLRQQNAELLSALKTIDRYNDSPVNYDSYINKIVEAAIAKATGGE